MTSSFTSRLGTSPEEAIKAPVAVVSTTNITLTGEQTIAGVAVVAGDRVGVGGQTDATENGIYDCNVSAWTRSTDFNDAGDVISGLLVSDANSGVLYQVTFDGDYVAGTTLVTFSSTSVTTASRQAGGYLFAAAAGAANVITAAFEPALQALTNGMQLRVRAIGANTIAGVTFNPDSQGAKAIRRDGNQALAIGDIPRADYDMILRFNSSNDVWELLNPATNRLFAVAAGTADIITATINPTLSGLIDGTQVCVRAIGANTITGVTFNPDSQGAKTIKRDGNQALIIGDIPRAGYEMILRYNSSNDVWELLNPYIDDSPEGLVTINFASDTDLTLSSAQAANKFIILTDTGIVLTTTRNVIFPTDAREWVVINNTAQTLTAKTSAGTGITITASNAMRMYGDGVNMEKSLIGDAFFNVLEATTPCLPDSYITGLIGSQAADTAHDITISAGAVRDTTGAYDLRLTSAMTKQIDAVWVAGDAAGGLDTGTFAATTEYWYFLIRKDSDASIDVLISASYSSPTMPAGYTYRSRPIHWVKSDGVPAIIDHKVIEMTGGGIAYAWATPIRDINLANTLTTTARPDALSVPTGLKVKANINVHAYDAVSTALIYVSDPDTVDLAPSTSVAPLLSFLSTTGKDGVGQLILYTNTSKQIRSRASIATVDAYQVATLGFEWGRK